MADSECAGPYAGALCEEHVCTPPCAASSVYLEGGVNGAAEASDGWVRQLRNTGRV
jgi:hypothetical protein